MHQFPGYFAHLAYAHARVVGQPYDSADGLAFGFIEQALDLLLGKGAFMGTGIKQKSISFKRKGIDDIVFIGPGEGRLYRAQLDIDTDFFDPFLHALLFESLHVQHLVVVQPVISTQADKVGQGILVARQGGAAQLDPTYGQ